MPTRQRIVIHVIVEHIQEQGIRVILDYQQIVFRAIPQMQDGDLQLLTTILTIYLLVRIQRFRVLNAMQGGVMRIPQRIVIHVIMEHIQEQEIQVIMDSQQLVQLFIQ
jgi:hypothetical protein